MALAFLSGCASCADWQRPRAYHCFPDASTPLGVEDPQCGPNWRCGLEERCHEIGDPKPWLCQTDSDCEADWRCGPEGTCLDSTLEALRPNAFAGALRVRLVSPLVSGGAPTAVASASYPVSQACGPDVPARSVAFVTDAGTARSVSYPQGRTLDCDAGTAVFSALSVAAPMSLPPLALADTPHATFVLAAGGQLCRYPVSDDQAFGGCDGIKLDFAATALRSSTAPGLPVVAHASMRYALLHPDGRFSVARRVTPPVLQAAQPLFDVLPVTLDNGRAGLLALSPAGIFAAELPADAPDSGVLAAPADDAWVPAGFPGIACAGGAPVSEPLGELRSLHLVHGAPVLAGVVREASGFERIVVFGGSTYSSPDLACPARAWDGATLGRPLTCAACPSGALEAFTAAPLPQPGRYAIEARCRDATAMRAFASVVDEAGCITSPDPLPVLEAKVSATAGPSVSVSAGAAGELWRQTGAGFSREALFLDRAPALVLGGDDDLIAGAAPVSVLLPGGFIEVEAGQLFSHRAGEGLVAGTTGLDLLASVQGLGRAAVREGDDAGLPPTVVELEPDGSRGLLAAFTTSEAFKPPYRAAAVTGDAGTVLVVSAFDALLAAEVQPGAEVSLATAPELRVKLVPLNRSEITSLTLLPTHRYTEGWLLSSGRLFLFFADNPTVWKSAESPLPPGEPVAVFHDGPRGRVGFRDGRVYALPGRVPLAPPLPDGEGPAADFSDACGQVLALGARQAFRLVVGPGVDVGAWEPVPLPEGAGRPVRLHPASDGAFVFFSDGRVVRLEGLVCL